MATYTITIENNGNDWSTYRLFMEVPQVQNNNDVVFPNVFAVGRPRKNNGSTQTFVVNTEAFAICGYKVIKDRVVISGDDNVKVTLTGKDDNNATITVRDGGPSFDGVTSGAPAGSYQMFVNPYDAVKYPDVFCGFGKKSPTADSDVSIGGFVIKGVNIAACWKARPSRTYIVTPVVKFYITTGDYTKGEVVQVTSIGSKQTIDFTNQGPNVFASFAENVDGSFTPVSYSQNPPSIMAREDGDES